MEQKCPELFSTCGPGWARETFASDLLDFSQGLCLALVLQDEPRGLGDWVRPQKPSWWSRRAPSRLRQQSLSAEPGEEGASASFVTYFASHISFHFLKLWSLNYLSVKDFLHLGSCLENQSLT